MGKVRLVTDSTAYLPADVVAEFGITVVPLKVNYQGESFNEGERYSDEEFYRLLRQGGFPTTSQPSAGEFIEAYKLVAEPDVSIISIHLSGGISGTINSAQSAATMLPELDITVYDSLSTLAGQAFLVREAAMMARQGAAKEQILATLDGMRDSMHVLFVVDTLEYLQRGGRIGGAQALIGSLLQIKPILQIKGKIEVFEKVRTRQKALAVIEKEALEFYRVHKPEQLRIAVVHVDALEQAQALLARLKENGINVDCEICSVGPVVGSHGGPGTLGIAFCAIP